MTMLDIGLCIFENSPLTKTASDSTIGRSSNRYEQSEDPGSLVFAKKRKKTHQFIRKSLRKQLGYISRNITTIYNLLDVTVHGLNKSQILILSHRCS